MGRVKKRAGSRFAELKESQSNTNTIEEFPATIEELGIGVTQKVIGRKTLRKNLRKLKKLKRQAHNLQKQKRGPGSKNELAKSIVSDSNTTSPKIKPSKKTKLSPDELKIKSNKAKENLKKEQNKQRVKQLQIANKLEDKNIRKIEKQLRLHKRKSKSIPKAFMDDGLDFLLEVCDPENRSKLAQEEFDFADNDAGFQEDLDFINDKVLDPPMEKIKKSKKKDEPSHGDVLDGDSDIEDEENSFSLNYSDQDERELDSDQDEMELDSDQDEKEFDSVQHEIEHDFDQDEIENYSDQEEMMSDEDVSEDESDKEPSQKPRGEKEKCWEDIYGRLRDSGGNVVRVDEEKAGKYVPPGKRLLQADNCAEMEKLKRQMKGLLNRLAESNLPGIVSSIEQLYLSHSRHNMQEAINSLVADSLVTPVLSPERLIMEHCVLIAALHANIGTEVGAQFLELIVRRFDTLYQTPHEEDKLLDNLILIVAHLYNFGLVASTLLIDILNKLAECFAEKDIELILIILRSVGFALRKDDPIALKQIILTLQMKAGQVADQPNRIRFMLDILLAIRNNNVAKIPNYDPSHSEHLRKILRNSLMRKGVSLSKMNITYDELLAADRRGRWWVVGSAWVGQGPAAEVPTHTVDGKDVQFSAELLEMARKQRMNTDVRRNIFCILMTAEDFIEASERLLRLNLKAQQEREILHVAIDCCLHEKKFNPYYAHIVQKFCRLHRRFQIATQFALWDRFKELSSLSQLQVAHMAKLLVQVISDGALTLSVLKVIQFTEMDRLLVRFLRQILLGLLLHPSETVVQTAFLRVASSKYFLLKEGLTLFIHHFLMKNAEKMDVDSSNKLRLRVQMAEQALRS